MKLNQEQLEWIVREVVRRLRAGGGEGQVGESRLQLADRLVTTETLRDQLDGVTQVDVARRAVVTPSAVDLLKERNITLIRDAK